jgi:hypothetical protein
MLKSNEAIPEANIVATPRTGTASDLSISRNTKSVDTLAGEVESLKIKILEQERLLFEKAEQLDRMKKSFLKTKLELRMSKRVSKSVDTILKDLGKIDIGDYIGLFNYILNTLPEKIRCRMKYHFPMSADSTAEMHDSDLFLALFETSYGLMDSRFGKDREIGYGSIVSQEKLDFPFPEGSEIYPVVVEGKVIGHVEFLRGDGSIGSLESIRRAVNQVLQYL